MKIMEIFEPEQTNEPAKSLSLSQKEARILRSALSAYGLKAPQEELDIVDDLLDTLSKLTDQPSDFDIRR